MKRRRSGGFTIVAAIFLLVVLAGLGAFAVTVSTTQQVGSALDIQGARAYQAARAGIEWGLYKVVRESMTCATAPAVTTNSFTMPSTSETLSRFTVTVVCSSYSDSYSGPTVYRIQSTACILQEPGACPNTTSTRDSGYVERRLEVTF